MNIEIFLVEHSHLVTVHTQKLRQPLSLQIERSMKRLDTVVKEREDALRLLQTGQERARPGAWRKDIFGRVYWYVASIHNTPL